MTSGLLDKLEKVELEGVLAHELSHIGNRDILLSTVIVVLVGFITLLADWFRHWAFFGGKSDDRDRGQLGVILMIAAIVLSVLAPIAGMLMQLAISRKREFLADADGATAGRPTRLTNLGRVCQPILAIIDRRLDCVSLGERVGR